MHSAIPTYYALSQDAPARDFDKKRCINFGSNISVSMRKTAQKGVQNRVVEQRNHMPAAALL
jgi:hypothetical protein